MNILFFAVSIIFSLWIIRNSLFWVSLWQLKEYRIDRLLIHLRDTRQGRNIIFSPFLFLKVITIFGYFYSLYFNLNLFPFQILAACIFIIEGFISFKEFSLHLLKRPIWTYKAITLFLLTILSACFFFLTPIFFEGFFWLLIIDRLIPVFVLFFVFLLALPTDFYQDIQIKRAIKKIRANKKLLVIGVTGSYGKSSAKDFIAQILSKQFRVLKTKGTNNTPTGVTNTILNGLNKNTEIFVVEMGAYKIGEIMEICQIVKPRIGVLTAVNDQHLSLFGSLENTKKAKYELIESLPKNGLALFNGNNDNAYELYKKTKKPKVLYSSNKNIPSDIFAKNILVNKFFVSFDVFKKGEKIHFRTPLIGKHNIENILPAIYLAYYLGMDSEKIKKAVSSLIPLLKTMIKQEVGGITIIDDTFNANPQSVMAVLDYMKIYSGKKILVLQPMIELGREGESEHRRVAKSIGIICDYLFVTNKNFYSQITKGILESGGKCKLLTGSFLEITKKLNNIAKKEDVVVFEGKEAGIILDKYYD